MLEGEKEVLEHLTEESKLGQMGLQVINNHIFKQAMIAREAQLFETFCNTKRDQEDVREEAWRTMQNLRCLQQYFDEVLTTGKLADIKLEELNKLN
jgi:predicted glycosyltransferase